jgi:hypothetical protein
VRKTDRSHSNPSAYTWYIRIPDMAQFIRDIAPVLESRLHGSRAHRYTGDLRLNFHDKTGLFMEFEDGKIKQVNNERPAIDKEDAGFPFYTFINLLFGHRTMDEMQAVLPDVFANRKATILLEAMFPKKTSFVRQLA